MSKLVTNCLLSAESVPESEWRAPKVRGKYSEFTPLSDAVATCCDPQHGQTGSRCKSEQYCARLPTPTRLRSIPEWVSNDATNIFSSYNFRSESLTT